MDTFSAFLRGQAARGREHMVFDWKKAAQRIAEVKPKVASAGLAGDWDYTGGPIYEDGQPVPREQTYTYLSSNWATPELEMDGLREDCFVMQSAAPDWDSDTYWPDEALALLNPLS